MYMISKDDIQRKIIDEYQNTSETRFMHKNISYQQFVWLLRTTLPYIPVLRLLHMCSNDESGQLWYNPRRFIWQYLYILQHWTRTSVMNTIHVCLICVVTSRWSDGNPIISKESWKSYGYIRGMKHKYMSFPCMTSNENCRWIWLDYWNSKNA